MGRIMENMGTAPRELKRVLVVEDNVPLRGAIARLVRSWGARPIEAGTAREALALLSPPPDLIISDIRLPDENAFCVFEAAARLWPKPLGVAISGEASADEAFRLAKIGVAGYLAKPLSLEELSREVEKVRRDAPSLDPIVATMVGQFSLHEVQDRMRSVMLHQALALTEGSRSGAARLLDVSRQAVQQILRGAANEEPPTEPKEETLPVNDSPAPEKTPGTDPSDDSTRK
jgi:DNA-binding response OmpR family regulator